MSFMSPERYPMDGSFESYSRLMRDVNAGIPEAIGALAWYQKYQELSRDVIRKRIPPPPPLPMPYSRGGNGGSTVVVPPTPIGGGWSMTGQPTREQLKELQDALDILFPRAKKEVAKPEPPKPAYSPPGVHITSHTRIGDEVRDAYMDHIGTMFSEGRMPQEEYHARTDAAAVAQTKEELEMLIQDLPQVTVRKPLPPAVVKEEKKLITPVFALLLFLASLSFIFAPGVGAFALIYIAFSAVWGTVFIASVARTPMVRKFWKEMKGIQ